MLSLLGTLGVLAALIGSLLLIWRGISVARGGSAGLVAPGRLMLAGAITAMAAMQIGLLTDNFTLAYIANHHSTTTPFPFDVATAWAALEGSIILWGLILAGFTWAVIVRYRRAPDPLGAAAASRLGRHRALLLRFDAHRGQPVRSMCQRPGLGLWRFQPLAAGGRRRTSQRAWPQSSPPKPHPDGDPPANALPGIRGALGAFCVRHRGPGIGHAGAGVATAQPPLDPGRLVISHRGYHTRRLVGV